MAFRFYHLSLLCILSVAMILLPAASANFQDPPGRTCIHKCKDVTDGVCYKSCYAMGFKAGGDCFSDNPDNSVCCCIKNN
ncbi:unnamed protein product [Lathyrus sativus]|nr:unnamed protein product [Lathyrus sativus]